MVNSNLFWQTRSLTQLREDHLTYFLASALECDAAFREGYQELVLRPLAQAGPIPRIAHVQAQASFAEQQCRPDLLLTLDDGRRVACEHKLDAPETPFTLDTGEIKPQLGRYLELDIAGVAYFRPHLETLPQEVLGNKRYIKPASQPHFVWSDLYHPLERGEHVVTQWLVEGFRRLGFTPAAPHVGPLVPSGDEEEVKENQRNFGKLWRRTRALASQSWKVGTGRRCELYLRPLIPTDLCLQVYVSPLAQRGTLLRFRCHTTDGEAESAREILERVAAGLPFPSELTTGKLANGVPFVDVLASLYMVFLEADKPEDQEDRLFRQIAPLLEALQSAGASRAPGRE